MNIFRRIMEKEGWDVWELISQAIPATIAGVFMIYYMWTHPYLIILAAFAVIALLQICHESR